MPQCPFSIQCAASNSKAWTGGGRDASCSIGWLASPLPNLNGGTSTSNRACSVGGRVGEVEGGRKHCARDGLWVAECQLPHKCLLRVPVLHTYLCSCVLPLQITGTARTLVAKTIIQAGLPSPALLTFGMFLGCVQAWMRMLHSESLGLRCGSDVGSCFSC